MQNDFDYKILDVTAHRPWPMPDSPWVMTQSWHDLLFAHWPVSAAALRDRIPPAFELDVFDNHAWVAVVPFTMSNVSPRGVPALPWISAFPGLAIMVTTLAINLLGDGIRDLRDPRMLREGG